MWCIISLLKFCVFYHFIVYKGKPNRQDAVIQQWPVADGDEYESEGRDGSMSVQSDDAEVQELTCYYETCMKCVKPVTRYA